MDGVHPGDLLSGVLTAGCHSERQHADGHHVVAVQLVTAVPAGGPTYRCFCQVCSEAH